MTAPAHDPNAGHEASLSYHQRMLADPHRIDGYERAIRALVRPGDVVLDLGAGTGILSMMAARRGARVHAVESMGIATVARDIILRNGLGDRITVHHADIRDLDVIEPVDLIVSDYMGRFIVDDYMLEAMDAARRWLKPGGRVCPARLTMWVAPAAVGHLPALDTYRAPLAGIDIRPLHTHAMRAAYGVDIPPRSVLAEPAIFGVLDPAVGGEGFDTTFEFELRQEGRLRGLIGWFEAELAPGVMMSTAPGIQTHWAQLLFPLPAARVKPGDRLSVRLHLDQEDEYVWRWSGALQREGRAPEPFDLEATESVTRRVTEAAPAPFLDGEAIDALNDEGAAAFERGDMPTAIHAFERLVMGLGPEHDDVAAGLYENLGLAYVHAGRWVPAVQAFMRALDGDLGSREQSARFLVDACFRSHRTIDAARWLAEYETTFGPHPRGWKAAGR